MAIDYKKKNESCSFISKKSNLPKTEFMIAVWFVLDSIYFIYLITSYISKISTHQWAPRYHPLHRWFSDAKIKKK